VLIVQRRSIIALVIGLLMIQGAFAAEPRLLSDRAKVDDADRAIVFIHGLLGSPGASFGNWPALIGQDQFKMPGHGKFSDFAVYAVDYAADFETRAKLDDVAVGVARDLEASQVFRRHRHVWLIAHSMGGLVLKRTVAIWKLEDRMALIDRVMAIGLLGVPSNGAPLATLAQGYNVDEIATMFGWNGRLIKDLTTNGGSYLDSIETDWKVIKFARTRDPQRRFTPIVSCGFETKPQITRRWWSAPFIWGLEKLSRTENLDTVVPKLFASTQCDMERGFPVTHTALIKPVDEADSIYVWLRRLVEDSINEGRREERVALTTAPIAGVSNPENFNLAERVQFLNDQKSQRNPEQIEFVDSDSEQRAKRLVLREGPFHGDTLLNAFSAAAFRNKCLQVSSSANRLTVKLKIDAALLNCTDRASVCSGQRCD
jgi:pimeloyl-ACP methyl ester carboxylesterase